jgi:beta-lactamase superfamily II metal-dependent hydrolase
MRLARIIVASFFGVMMATRAFAGIDDKRLDIYWVDTEGGAATLIVTPLGQSVLIDAGNPGQRDPTRIFKVAAQEARLTAIDNMVTTHYHIDHFGGAAELSKLIPIKVVWNNGTFPYGWEKPSQEYLDFKCDARKVLSPGEEIPLKQIDGGPPIHLKCIAARQKTIEAPPGATTNPACTQPVHHPRDLSDNINSIVQILNFGDFRFYDAGDLTWNMEIKLVCPNNLLGSVDVYQVTHHGLDLSNNPLLIAALSPTVAVMGNGPKKGCEPNTVAALRTTPSIQAIYQLHRNLKPGQDANNNPDAKYIANEKVDCDGNFVKLSVDPEAKTFTVSIPASKFERTFDVKKHQEPAK